MSGVKRTERPEALRRFKPYPAYRDSGVRWLGEIPASWGLKRLKRIVAFRGGGTPSKDNLEYWRGDIPWVSPKDMKVSVVEETEDKITTEAVRESATKLVPAGAVLIVVRSGILVHSIPVALAGREVTLNQDLKALIPASEIAAEYLMYLISGMHRELLVEWKKEGATVESLELDLVADTPTPLPAIPEQRAIAAFLDRETARIDALVAKKERLIELLQEQRTALITRAVTKGLDPNVPMKDSGVEWLGEIPAHWEVKRLRHVGDAIIGLTYEPDDVVGPDDDGVLVLRASNVNHGRVVLDDNVFVRRAIPEHLRTRLGDILICARSGSRALIGKCARIDTTAAGMTFGTFMTVFRSSCNAFLFYVLNSTIFDYQSGLFLTSTINQLTVNSLKNLTVPVPPKHEQSALAQTLDRETARIDALVAKVREVIDRLKELRTALISAAVTGKIDVREG